MRVDDEGVTVDEFGGGVWARGLMYSLLTVLACNCCGSGRAGCMGFC